MNFLKRLAPCFSINEVNIKILREPKDFYEFIKLRASDCEKRIVIASLYLGSGDKEKSLVESIFKSINSNLNNPNFRVHLLFDSNRGSRSVKGCDSDESSSRFMCLPLLRLNDTRASVKVSFYHTPNLRGWLYQLLPQKWNEIIGLQHMKVYLFDDCLVMSGANLSEDYFTNRQDRYIVFEDSPQLCDFYEELVEIVGARSLRLTSSNQLKSPHIGCDPISGDLTEYMSDFQKAIENFISIEIVKSQKREKSELNELTRVYPLIQMGLYGIAQDQMVLMKLFKSLSRDENSQHHVSLASGYFNLDEQNESLLFEMANTNIPIEILSAAPEANGFFNAKGLMKYIPDVYTDILENFQSKSYNLPIKTIEWKKKDWTFHAKGFWIDKLINDCTRVVVTLIGSTNYGYRSCFRDLESEILIETQSERLQAELLAEKNRIFSDGFDVERPANHRLIPVWVHWVVPAVKYLF